MTISKLMARSSMMAAAALASVALATGAAQAADQPQERQLGVEASIPFVNHGGIYSWQAIDRNTLYIQDRHRNWYKATLFSPCFDLPYAEAIGFRTMGIDRFDRFSSVLVRGDQCQVQSLVTSAPPPSKHRKGGKS